MEFKNKKLKSYEEMDLIHLSSIVTSEQKEDDDKVLNQINEIVRLSSLLKQFYMEGKDYIEVLYQIEQYIDCNIWKDRLMDLPETAKEDGYFIPLNPEILREAISKIVSNPRTHDNIYKNYLNTFSNAIKDMTEKAKEQEPKEFTVDDLFGLIAVKDPDFEGWDTLQYDFIAVDRCGQVYEHEKNPDLPIGGVCNYLETIKIPEGVDWKTLCFERPKIRTERRVKSKEALLRLFEENGYIYQPEDDFQFEKWKHPSNIASFIPKMFDFCGKLPHKLFTWNPEWLEDVEVKDA